MNELLEKLGGGDLRSDGRADEVADEVVETPQLLALLIEGLTEPDDVIRGRTAHALEKISRTTPEMVQGLLPHVLEVAGTDELPMVKWHLAMLFANVRLSEEETDLVVSALFDLLKDKSVFVKSWSVASLCILGRRTKSRRWEIIDRIKALHNDDSIAIRVRVSTALHVLENENEPIPPTWSKTKVL